MVAFFSFAYPVPLSTATSTSLSFTEAAPSSRRSLSSSGPCCCSTSAPFSPAAARRSETKRSPRRTTAAPKNSNDARAVAASAATDSVAAASPSPSPAPSDASSSTNNNGVYAAEPLETGVTKAVLSAFVADEAGIINRVAGVFARRGANIESLAVGLNIDKALFTIVVAGSRSTVANLVKQTAKLVKVRYVEDISRSPRVERELVLFKVAAPSSAGSLRAEVLQLADIFRARVVDVGPECVTLCCTGDAGKSAALQRALESTSGGMNSRSGKGKSIVREIARTGRVALKRGPALLEMGGWGDSGAPAPSASAAAAAAKSRGAAEGDGVYGGGGGDGEGSSSGSGGGGTLDETPADAAVLDAPRYSELGDPDCDAATLSILVADVPGVLNQVTGVLARRGVNVQSLAVGPAEDVFVQSCPQSRITVVIPGTSDGSTAKIVKQLEKLVYVTRVEDLSDIPYVSRELMLVKVRAPTEARRRLTDLAAIFRGSVCDVSAQTLTIELVGREDKMRALLTLLEPFGVLEVARTGRVALSRDSGVDTRQLDRSKSERRVML